MMTMFISVMIIEMYWPGFTNRSWCCKWWQYLFQWWWKRDSDLNCKQILMILMSKMTMFISVMIKGRYWLVSRELLMMLMLMMTSFILWTEKFWPVSRELLMSSMPMMPIFISVMMIERCWPGSVNNSGKKICLKIFPQRYL